MCMRPRVRRRITAARRHDIVMHHRCHHNPIKASPVGAGERGLRTRWRRRRRRRCPPRRPPPPRSAATRRRWRPLRLCGTEHGSLIKEVEEMEKLRRRVGLESGGFWRESAWRFGVPKRVAGCCGTQCEPGTCGARRQRRNQAAVISRVGREDSKSSTSKTTC